MYKRHNNQFNYILLLQKQIMQTLSTFKRILIAVIALFILSCNNDSKKITADEVKIETIRDTFTEPEPPPPPPPPPASNETFIPQLEIKAEETKCFANEGLKYKTTVTLGFNKSEASGFVTSEDLESGKKRSTGFKGSRNGNEFTVTFIDVEPPDMGVASEWTNQPWTIKKVDGKEILSIIFNAKNYDNNKWENLPYEFELTDCK